VLVLKLGSHGDVGNRVWILGKELSQRMNLS
jgi:hypothetical protein